MLYSDGAPFELEERKISLHTTLPSFEEFIVLRDFQMFLIQTLLEKYVKDSIYFHILVVNTSQKTINIKY
jgi:hypothetical protein